MCKPKQRVLRSCIVLNCHEWNELSCSFFFLDSSNSLIILCEVACPVTGLCDTCPLCSHIYLWLNTLEFLILMVTFQMGFG